jgi:predicted nucleic acid-binding protein
MNAAGNLVFVDTNVLLYEVDGADPAKQLLSRRWLDALWQAGSARVSWQVLNEFYVNATRKTGLPAATCRSLVETYVQWKPTSFSLSLLRRAWYWTDRSGISYGDALILAAAERSGCRWLLSEDFSHGRRYGSVQVVDPFNADPDEFFAA